MHRYFCILLIYFYILDLDLPKVVPFKNGKIYEGDIFKLTCLYSTSDDKVSVSWFKDSVKIYGNTNELNIATVARNDSDVYTCSVDNGLSAKVASYHLLVYCEFVDNYYFVIDFFM